VAVEEKQAKLPKLPTHSRLALLWLGRAIMFSLDSVVDAIG